MLLQGLCRTKLWNCALSKYSALPSKPSSRGTQIWRILAPMLGEQHWDWSALHSNRVTLMPLQAELSVEVPKFIWIEIIFGTCLWMPPGKCSTEHWKITTWGISSSIKKKQDCVECASLIWKDIKWCFCCQRTRRKFIQHDQKCLETFKTLKWKRSKWWYFDMTSLYFTTRSNS